MAIRHYLCILEAWVGPERGPDSSSAHPQTRVTVRRSRMGKGRHIRQHSLGPRLGVAIPHLPNGMRVLVTKPLRSDDELVTNREDDSTPACYSCGVSRVRFERGLV
jgi:hypothetical protein